MKFFVTGSTGFLGRHLASTLRTHGHDVVALVRKKSDIPTGADPTLWPRGDVLDRASIERAATGCDGVFHCAGKVSRRPEDAEELYKIHVEGTKNVLDACIAKNVRRAVVASTSGTIAVSDDPDRVSTEADEALVDKARHECVRARRGNTQGSSRSATSSCGHSTTWKQSEQRAGSTRASSPRATDTS